jgi:hypothetical protein
LSRNGPATPFGEIGSWMESLRQRKQSHAVRLWVGLAFKRSVTATVGRKRQSHCLFSILCGKTIRAGSWVQRVQCALGSCDRPKRVCSERGSCQFLTRKFSECEVSVPVTKAEDSSRFPQNPGSVGLRRFAAFRQPGARQLQLRRPAEGLSRFMASPSFVRKTRGYDGKFRRGQRKCGRKG